MDGLIIKPKWGELILNGLKSWEIRGSNTSHRGRHYLIESGTNKVYGEFDLVDSQPLTERDFYDNLLKHQLPNEYLYNSDLLKRYKTPYRWAIENVEKYDEPIYYEHPQGAVIWVKDVILHEEMEDEYLRSGY